MSIDYLLNLCLDRDAKRCRHCGSADNIAARQIVKKDSDIGWHLSNLITLCDGCNDISEVHKIMARNDRFGVLLCGGKGTRLYPLTRYQNKHTLPIGLMPMIFYPLKTLRAFGVKRAMIVIDREGANSTMEMLGSGKEFGMELSYRVQEGAGGIADALYLAKDFVSPSDEIICILGDNVFDNTSLDTDIKLGDQKACVYVKEVPNPQDYGVARISNGRVAEIIEKPKTFVSNSAVLGLYVYTHDVFDVIQRIKPSKRGELEISSVNDYYAAEGELQFKTVKGYWADCGSSIQRYCEASLYGAKQAKVSAQEIDIFKSIVFDDK